MLTRRGFLQILGVATGAVVLDPIAKLWVPAPVQAASIITVEDLSVRQIAAIAEQQSELDELALLVARQMTDRLERHRSTVLAEIMYRHSGIVQLPPNTLDVEGLGVGTLEPSPGRTMVTAQETSVHGVRIPRTDLARQLAGLLSMALPVGLDTFAPIGRELRPGEPFSEDTFIGFATDPESGLSVRVLRFEQDARGGRLQQLTGVEMAGGRWRPR